MTSRVLGYVMARNEWPLVGLAITHAFHFGLDHIVVVDHASNDKTQSGLKKLKEYWEDRLTIIRLDMHCFAQASTTAVVMSYIDSSSYDWVYVFDSDEFMLCPDDSSLKSLLSKIPQNIGALRYEIEQWVVPSDMDDLSIHQYARIVDKAIPCVFLNQSGEILADQIEKGYINYFDLPFPSKVIVRGKYAHKLYAGAHLVAKEPDIIEQNLAPEVFRIAHIPLLSRRRIKLKALHGKLLISENYPAGHGWQNQAIYRLDQTGQLDVFWNNHSINHTGVSTSICKPITVTDTTLSLALHRAFPLFIEIQNKVSDSEDDTHKKKQVRLDGLIWLVDNLTAENVQLQESLKVVIKNRDDHVNTLSLEISSLVDQIELHKGKLTEISNAMQDSLVSHQRQVEDMMNSIQTAQVSHKQQLLDMSNSAEAVLNSNCWKLTAPIRYITTKIRSIISFSQKPC